MTERYPLRRLAAVCALGVACVMAMAAEAVAQTPPAPPAPEQEPKQEQEERAPVRLLWRNRPSLRFGNWLRIDLRIKTQGDVRGFAPDVDVKEGTFDFHRGRGGISGTFLRHFEYEIEREFTDFRNPWRDVFVNVSAFNAVQVKAGKFKVPFGLEQTTGPMDLDFVNRALISSQLAPARDIGVMVHGRFFGQGLRYEAGGFQHDGDNAKLTEPLFFALPDARRSRRSFAGRLIGRPFRPARGLGNLRSLEIGAAFTTSEVPEGLSGMRGRTVYQYVFFEPVYVNGRRLRFGAELNWTPGPLSVRAEWMRVADDRQRQGLGDVDLSDLISRGWYVSGTWVVTGDPKGDGVNARKPFPHRGAGAIELAMRYDELRFGSASKVGPAFANPRAEHILENADRVWTFGLNWYANRWVKLQVNVSREMIEDVQRAPKLGREEYWSQIFRMQFAM